MATKALYTKLFGDFVSEEGPQGWWSSFKPFGPIPESQTFKDALYRRWRFHEIFTDDSDEFIARAEDFINSRVTEWKAKLDAYAIEVDPMEGRKTTIHREADGKDYAFPNKSISAPNGYQTSGDEQSSTVTTTGISNVLEQRELAIRRTHNLMLDFADECAPLFYQLYD